MPKPAAIYCRLSYAPDGSVEKVDRQEADCRELARRLGWRIDERHVYKDNSRSAWQRNRKRPRWDAMLAAVEADEVDSIITWHGDRLVRQPWDLEMLLRLADDRRLRLASVSGTRDLSNADDRYILRIEVAGACRESDNTSRRVQRDVVARIERGAARGGALRPFGFERDNVTHKPDEVAIIKEVAERMLSGQSNYGVVAWLNTVCRGTGGALWQATSLKQMMTRPRIAGLLEHKGEIVGKAAWDPILDPDTWHDVCALMTERATFFRDPQEGARRYLLSGIAECGSCHVPLVAHRSSPKAGYRYIGYVCKNKECTMRVVRAMAHLDAYVEGRTLQLLSNRAWLDSVLATDHPQVGAQIAELERRRAAAKQTLKTLADHPDVSADDILESLESFRRKIAELRAQRHESARQQVIRRMAGITREEWEATPLDIQRTTVRALWHITVLPRVRRGPGFEPDRVELLPVKDG